MIKINKIVIGVDYDNILFDSTRAFNDLLNEYTGLKFTMNDIVQWDMRKVYPIEYSKLVEDLWSNPKLWQRVYPLENSQYYMKLLDNDPDLDIYIVTDTAPNILDTKVKLLNKEYPWIDTSHKLCVFKNKQMLKLDIMIDDGLHNLVDADYTGLLYEYPWNKNLESLPNNITMVKSWQDIYEYINHFKMQLKGVI